MLALVLAAIITEMLPLAGILCLSEYVSFGNKFILPQYFDFSHSSIFTLFWVLKRIIHKMFHSKLEMLNFNFSNSLTPNFIA